MNYVDTAFFMGGDCRTYTSVPLGINNQVHPSPVFKFWNRSWSCGNVEMTEIFLPEDNCRPFMIKVPADTSTKLASPTVPNAFLNYTHFNRSSMLDEMDEGTRYSSSSKDSRERVTFTAQ